MNHYGTLAGALEYNAIAANGAAWSADGVTDEQRTAALIRASRSLDGQYGSRYPGQPTQGRSQSLGWPRDGAIDHCAQEAIPSDTVPVEIEQATYALALVELQTPGASSPTFTAGRVMKREEVKGISRERFGPNDGVSLNLANMRTQRAEVEDALRCILTPVSLMACILRV